MENNKERAPLEHYQARYRLLEPAEAAQRCGFPFDAERGAFSLTVLGFRLFAAWPAFSLVPESESCPSALYGPESMILMIRYLTEGAYKAPDGRFLTYRELPWGEVYDRNFQGRCVGRLARTFGARLRDFEDAVRKLGGALLTLGDASCELPYLAWVPIRLILWAGDDEFPASSQFLFSGSRPSAFSAEDLAVVGELVIRALKETAAPPRARG
jgi:hypothetical protein